ncbi:MAG TPA: class I tRNA ligase family protein, partial [Thermoplasmata archaeon]|nr:class I tRNA ligase family protein [Thermoplasmata archaeon]
MEWGSTPFSPHTLEAEARRLWAARGLPPSNPVLGPVSGPRTHAIVAPGSPDEPPGALLHRAVVADAHARYRAFSGRSTDGTIACRGETLLRTLGSAALAAGVGLGEGRATSTRAVERTALQAMVDRLAAAGILTGREAPLRSCPRCQEPRGPSAIVYQEEEGTAYLVRFPLTGPPPATSLLVWTDALWKLLGTTAVLVGGEVPYVTVSYRRRGHEERLITGRSSLERLAAWLPGGETTVLEERPGRALEGLRYDHPLASESPMLGGLPAPSNGVHASAEVSDTGTGLVALVPNHGGSDGLVATALGAVGWPVLDPDLNLSRALVHKYQGLPIDAAEAFVQRDLTESGLLFAQLRVKRGVPRCGACGTALVWEVGRSWCLDPTRLPPERLEEFHRLLPDDPAPPPNDAVPWPVALEETSSDPADPELFECVVCRRLAPISAERACPCGGARVRVRRTLLAPFLDALAAWVPDPPIEPNSSVHLLLPDRRRAPMLCLHLAAREAAGARPSDLRLTRIPTLPRAYSAAGPADDGPWDALRSVLIGLEESPSAGAAGLVAGERRERRRLERAWRIAAWIADRMGPERTGAYAAPVTAHLAHLPPEDRAFLSLFERMRSEVLRLADLGRLPKAQRILAAFFEDAFVREYLPLAIPRLKEPGVNPRKLAAFSVVSHVIATWAELYAPIAPYTMEAVHRSLRGDAQSVFERPFTPILESILDPAAERAYGRWLSILRAVERARRRLGIPPDTSIARVTAVLPNEAVAAEWRATASVIERLAGIQTFEVASPDVPWEGRLLDAVPVTAEIQRAYGAAAPRLLRLLEGMPGRRVQESLRGGAFELVLDGRSVRILPSMIEFRERPPAGVVAIPWEPGELYVAAPEEIRPAGAFPLPPLSPAGYRFVHRIRRRLAHADRPGNLPGIAVAVGGTFAEEIARHRVALERYLGVPELQIVPSAETFPRTEILRGRGRSGDRWIAWVPGVAAPSRAARRRGVRSRPRILERSPEEAGDRTDFLDDAVRARDAALEEWVRRLDAEIGRPLVGPAKLRNAWDAGIHDFDSLAHATFDALAPIPGFGPYVAAAIVGHYGGTVPVRARPAF